MRFVPHSLLGGALAVAVASAAFAQGAAPARPASAPASAPVTAASRVVPTRNAAVMAAENAKEPGVQRPEERVIPQISVPLKPRNSGAAAAATASAPVGSVPGAVNDMAARCMAASDAADKAACQRRPAASEPVEPKR
jgi:hypothetical protein